MSTKISIINCLTDEEYEQICSKFKSAAEYLRSINCSENGRYVTLINKRRRELGLNWYKITIQTKDCPVCNVQFTPKRKEQVTCSRACSNTHFRSGRNNGNFKEDKIDYRSICFSHNEKKCIVCEETNIVAVHHYDENHNNNEPTNLVPLCPTHHSYMHSKYKYLIEDIVNQWRKNELRRK